jgi:phosphoribosyl 1,2-cyclic phosphodiesterase
VLAQAHGMTVRRRRRISTGFMARFWGVRGSIAAPGPGFAGVGGNTSCVEVRAGDETIILDAGTVVVPLGQAWGQGVHATFLFTHLHWDHIQGFPFFEPAYDPASALTLYGPGACGAELRASLARLMRPPNFPVTLAVLEARLDFRSIRPGDEIQVGPACVRTAALNHPQGCLGYRIEVDGVSLVHATDTEQFAPDVLDPGLVEFAEGADVLIHDAQYTDEEYDGRCGPARWGWGHSTVTAACRLARAAGVKQLVLFHHDPSHDDAVVDRLVEEARSLFGNVVTAREGMTLPLAPAAPTVGEQDEACGDWHAVHPRAAYSRSAAGS